MIARYSYVSQPLIGFGFLVHAIGIFAFRLSSNPASPSWFAMIAINLGIVVFTVGFAFLAKAKGHSAAWCLMVFLCIVGVFVIPFLPDLAPDGKLPRRKKRRPRGEDYDEDEGDRPRRRKRRHSENYDEDAPVPALLLDKCDSPDDEIIQAQAVEPAVPAHKITACFKCRKSLKVPMSLVGKRVKCPGCGTGFVA